MEKQKNQFKHQNFYDFTKQNLKRKTNKKNKKG